MKKTYILVYLIFISNLFAWGKTGHRIIGYIAEKHLTLNSRIAISSILGHTDLASVSTWADEIKSDSTWDHAYDWHWATIPDNEQYIAGKYSGKAVEKAKYFLESLVLQKTNRFEKEIALKFLVHIIGDLHQPLHVGNGKDRGGNDIPVQWFGEETNLHKVWDEELVRHQELSYTEYGDYLLIGLTKLNKDKWFTADINEIITESKESRIQVYNFKSKDLSWNYIYQNKELLDKRLLQGGIRLAGMLNKIFM